MRNSTCSRLDPGRALASLCLLCVVGGVLGSVAGCGEDESLANVRDFNVALIVLDTTRADAVEGYADGRAHTPTLAKLAAEGVLFRNARTTSAWTLPSHGSLFTSLYPSRHGAHSEGTGLDPKRTTLPELLSKTHDSAAFSENPHIVAARGFARGFEHFDETWREQEDLAVPPPTEQRIAEWFKGRDASKPFFLFVNLMTPHLPYTPPRALEERFVPKLDRKIIDNFRSIEEGHARMQMMGSLGLGRLDFSILRALYRAEVSYVDQRLQDILDLIGGASVLDRTLVVVVGDHGENIGHHGLMEHQFCLYESLLRVPMIMRLPAVLPRGLVRDEPVQLVDVMPTILDVLEWPRDQWPAMEGRSLLGQPVPMDRPVYAETMRPDGQQALFHAIDPEFDFTPFLRRLKSIQVENLKLIVPEPGERELYDISKDPAERINLATQYPAEADRLEAQLLDWARQLEPGQSKPAELDPQTREALRKLGYAE
ncbi:MAG: sulfatase [Deltaproteobacteria bacterium]|nr:sulfatase [Deltaproteobacteria bacterium]